MREERGEGERRNEVCEEKAEKRVGRIDPSYYERTKSTISEEAREKGKVRERVDFAS